MGGKFWLCLLSMLISTMPPTLARADQRPSATVVVEPAPHPGAAAGPDKPDPGPSPAKPRQPGDGRRAIDAHAQKSLIDRIKNCCKDTQK